MVKYDVLIFPAAERDLEAIAVYLGALSPQAAYRAYDILAEKIASLSTMPERCPFVHEVALRAKGYRVLVADDHLVFFVVKSPAVQVRRIIHGKRHYEWLL